MDIKEELYDKLNRYKNTKSALRYLEILENVSYKDEIELMREHIKELRRKLKEVEDDEDYQI